MGKVAEDIYDWIRLEIKASRGTELRDTMNPGALPALFHKPAGYKVEEPCNGLLS